MRLTRLVSLAAVAVLAAACSSSGSSPSMPPPESAPASAAASEAPMTSGMAAPSAAASAAAAATRIEVTLSDTLKITPAAMTVPAGTPVTFVVKNGGTMLHEFVLGDQADQQAHEDEMMANGGMIMDKDEPMAIGVDPGTTKELTVTFDKPGSMMAACHVSGHWAAGMQATITIQ